MSAKLAELVKESLEFLERLERSPHCAYEMVDQGLKADLTEALAQHESDRALAALTAEQRRLGMYGDEKHEPVAWGRKDQLQQAQRGGFLCAMYSGTEGRTDLVPLYLSPQQEPDRLDAERQVSGFMSRATHATSSGSGYKQISFRFAELGDAEQMLLWAKSYGAKAANHYIDAAKEAKP